ncbi:MAG: hypothetical protein RLY58_256 [Pseudomonadota bacterium]|jgi:zinc/manganese transport system substrate-binding protein
MNRTITPWVWLKQVLSLSVLGVMSIPAWAQLNVVTTTSSMGMLARTVGGAWVQVTELAPPDRDAHTVQVKPSMIQAVRRAQVVVSVGAELEQGWLPLVIDNAANPPVRAGQNGYFEAAAQVTRLDVQGAAGADRARGDVHPLGNPHVQLDPVRMGVIAHALAQRLALLDPNHAAQFKANAQAFDQLIQQHMPRWQAKTQGVAGVLLYHHDANYLLNRLGVPILGYIEPMAGMPPTAQHIAALVGQYRGQAGQVISMTYQTNGGIGTLAQALHWNASALPADVPTGATAGQYVQLIDQWVAVLSQVR